MKDISAQVSSIIANVRDSGDKALLFYLKKFDKVSLVAKKFKVPLERIKDSRSKIDALTRKAIEKAAENIETFHREELDRIQLSWRISGNGSTLGQSYSPVQKAGIYVPGGRFPYPSTVLMSAIPARVAGVRRIVMVTPPRGVNPVVLYAAQVAGVTEIYSVGGPAAIAALAYGTKTIPRVDMIVGPGNAYVNEAKRQVYGAVGIDSLAGPSEVAIIADAGADAAFVQADLCAQAEHDPLARAYLFSPSRELIASVVKGIPGQFRAQITAARCTLPEAVRRVNEIAPEHLELLVKDPRKIAVGIRNAGAIFAGYATPTAVGDYWAGPSHVLPTAGSARFSSGVSVMTFLKRSSYIEYSRNRLAQDAPLIERFSREEGLDNHNRSVRVRRGRNEN